MNMHANIHAFDRKLIYEHVSVLHGRAAGIDGVLVLAVYGEEPVSGRKLKFPVEKFSIGEVDRMVDTIMLYESREHANVYIGLHVMSRDIGSGNRGAKKNIRAVFGLVADMDGDTGKVGKMPLEPSYVVETSPGNFQSAILFDRPVSPQEADLLAKGLQVFTGSDSGTGDIDHIWRVPGTLNSPNATKLKRGRANTPVPVTMAKPWSGLVYSPEELRTALDAPKSRSEFDDEASLDELFLRPDLREAIKNTPEGADRSALFMSAVLSMKAHGRTVDEIERLFARYPNGIAAKYAGRLRQEVERAYFKPDQSDKSGADATKGRNTDKPTIKIVPGDIERIVDDSEAALIDADRGVYQRGAEIVSVSEAKLATFNSGEVIGQRIYAHAESVLAEDLCASADYVKFDTRSKKFVPSDPPAKIVKILKDRKGRLRLPVLQGITAVPIVRPDGSIRVEPGYDPVTGLLLDPLGTVFPDLDAHPTRAHADKALGVLLDLIASFPFVEPADQGVAISTFLTAVHRRSLRTAPLHAFSSPVAGSGKSLLVDIASMIATGHEAAVIAQGKTEEETEKRLNAALRYGDALLCLDNLEQPLGGEFLCSVLTQNTVRFRILGQTELLEFPTNVMMTATGNNLTVAGDMSRRCVLASLDPEVERPELRRFTRDPIAEVRADRGRYVHAIMTIVRAYRQSAQSPRPTPLGSFESWSNTIRGALIWLGQADPVATMEKVRASDPRLDELTAVMEHWDRAIVLGSQVTTNQLIKTANKKDTNNFGGVSVYENEDLREFLFAVAGVGGAVSAQRLGTWLKRQKGRIVEGRFIERMDESGGVAKWRLSQKR